MNYFEDHIGDYAAATAHLSWDEDMAYTRLIRAYYHSERPIPQDQAYRLARASSAAQRKAVDAVLREFFTLEDDGYHQKRCDEEIARFKDKQDKAKRSADARWGAKRTQSERNANAMRTHSEGNAPRHQTPDTISSVANATGGKPPADQTKAELWASAKALLESQGMPKANCGTFVGKLAKDYGDEVVLEAVRSAVVTQPADAASFIKRLCQNASGERRATATDRRISTIAGLTNPGASNAIDPERTIDVAAKVVA